MHDGKVNQEGKSESYFRLPHNPAFSEAHAPFPISHAQRSIQTWQRRVSIIFPARYPLLTEVRGPLLHLGRYRKCLATSWLACVRLMHLIKSNWLLEMNARSPCLCQSLLLFASESTVPTEAKLKNARMQSRDGSEVMAERIRRATYREVCNRVWWISKILLNSNEGLFAGTVGVRRLLKMFDKYGIKTTWFIPGHSLETFPEECTMIRDSGHEM